MFKPLFLILLSSLLLVACDSEKALDTRSNPGPDISATKVRERLEAMGSRADWPQDEKEGSGKVPAAVPTLSPAPPRETAEPRDSCGLTASEKAVIQKNLTGFSEIKQLPFTIYTVETEINGKVEVTEPQKELEKKRLNLLRPVVELVVTRATVACGVKILDDFTAVLLTERGGKPLRRVWIEFDERADNHNLLAHTLEDARELLRSKKTKIPALSRWDRGTVDGFPQSRFNPIFAGESESVVYFASKQNMFVKDVAKKKYYLGPAARVVGHEFDDAGALTVAVKFVDLTEPLLDWFSENKSERSWLKEASKGQWEMMPFDSVQVYDTFELPKLGETPKSLVEVQRTADPELGVIYQFVLPQKVLADLKVKDAKGREYYRVGLRLRWVAFFDGELEETPSDSGEMEFDVEK